MTRELTKAKLDKLIGNRKMDIAETIKKIESDQLLLNDYVSQANALHFDHFNKGIQLHGLGSEGMGVTPLSQSQIGERLGIHNNYLKRLTSGSERELNLAVHNLNELAEMSAKRNLIRVVDGTVRGFLSDRYRRLNTSILFIQFLQSALESGSVLVDAYSNDKIDFIEVVHPEIIEIQTKNNGIRYLIAGSRFGNSNYGYRKLDLSMYYLELVCTNGMWGDRLVNEMHLGSRIPDNIIVSDETVELDNRAMAGIIKDSMNQLYVPERVESLKERYMKASESEIDIAQEIKILGSNRELLQGEIKSVEAVLTANRASDGMEGSGTLLKLSEALTAVARDSEGERKRDLEAIAGKMLGFKI